MSNRRPIDQVEMERNGQIRWVHVTRAPEMEMRGWKRTDGVRLYPEDLAERLKATSEKGSSDG